MSKSMVERVHSTVYYNAGEPEGISDAIDATHIRVILCANGGYDSWKVNKGIIEALETGLIHEVDGGYRSAIHPRESRS
ncbi:hypothetical protein [Natronorarus salvus]|uniref:hypothetical protein n=1 Tax=Natronorarus salvus TaxID=3117733 RepID=UPI002F26B882